MKAQFLRIILLSAGAWSILQVGHEIIGHGFMVIMVGGEVLSVDGMYLNHNLEDVSDLGLRWVKAGGSLFNIVWAIGAFLLLRSRTFKNYTTNYFLWVSVALNLMQSGSYIGFGRYISKGMDWSMILEGIQNRMLWEFMETFGGLLLLTFGVWVAVRYGKWFMGWGTISSSKILYWVPLFTSTVLSVVSSVLIPTTDRFMMLMGGIGNGFTFLFPLFVLGFFSTKKEMKSPSFVDTKNLVLQLFLMGMVVFYLLVMSPGIEFNGR
ncbi:hypothetical protein GTQ34_10220 [Muricauda sp. JGD-17]|uniref:Uncharacterized protein n=1 Tax=Flagellimonas ochracea TaxID=2696472 RepID=A0A964TDN3_9FLAO|nr:hypothetical protein [Allomuricauda ochracea]NAY92294.1 hypothetical protein [Allomuricauda ochracea]